MNERANVLFGMNTGDNSKGVVASGHEACSRAAAEILESGGNAFDAAVAAAFVSEVAEPMLSGTGGGGFFLTRTSEGKEKLWDFFVDSPGKSSKLIPKHHPITIHFPGADQVFNIGAGAAGVPGTLKGLLKVHEELGSIPLRQVIAPAIELAEKGVVLNKEQAYTLDLLYPIVSSEETGRKIYSKNGEVLKVGEVLKNVEYADFLKTLAKDSHRLFYEGDIAKNASIEIAMANGNLTEQDLLGYKVIKRELVAGSYRNWRFLTNPPPSQGGALLCESLRALEKKDLRSMSWGSEEHLQCLVEIMKESEKARTLKATSKGTTHISVCDAKGNVASLSTSNGEGCGHFMPGTGIMLNNMMGEDDLHPEGFHSLQPGVRVPSMMCPSLLLGPRGEIFAVGSGGSKRIRSAILQVVSNVIDFGFSVQDAVSAPRIHWDGDVAQVEPGFEKESLKKLSKKMKVNEWKVLDLYFGGANCVYWGLERKEAGGDPRRGGNGIVL